MRGEYLLLQLLTFALFFIIYWRFGLRFLKKKAFWQATAVTFVFFVFWEWWALSKGEWFYGLEYMIGTIGIYPIEQFVMYVLTPVVCITLWELSKKLWRKHK